MEQEKLYTLKSDNRQPARTIKLTEEEITKFCSTILKWRTQKQYASMKDRLFSTGSSTYDGFIEKVYQLKNK